MEALIISIALSNGVDPNLLLAICFKETRLEQVVTLHDGKSSSYGPCQVKNIAARQVASEGDINRLEDSVDVAAKYLKYNLKRCHGLISGLKAYNTGHCGKDSRYTREVLKYYDFFKDKYSMYAYY